LANDLYLELQRAADNAAQLVAVLQQSAVEIDFIYLQAWEAIKPAAQQILLEELAGAISRSSEYGIPEYAEQLLSVFSNPEIIGLVNPTLEQVSLRPAIDTVAGSRDDLWRGILLAKADLGIGNKLTPQQASDFWRDRIYRPAREGTGGGATYAKKSMEMTTNYGTVGYFNTLTARMAEWGGMAPYWIFLNEGNHGGGGGVPYPMAGPTRFVERAENRITLLLKQTIFEMTNAVTDSIEQTVVAFSQDPTMPSGAAISKGRDKNRRVFRRRTRQKGFAATSHGRYPGPGEFFGG
jgi:hypothetical protein